ncbi:PP2C family protein-serine/threonine phosphatase [Methylovirgula sp. 4M-Z18]|uniref:PP2C family protein-serine/threonine phosphatase n=1 Tax=Methylovirgula sp. 4M-Z18 TaxID=2293567 RepID=UPI000E2FD865|nr:protein phosphatase 2C domain-containing protein [Methylovirgula sp. 4M-Z18]RFB76364.1 serine/threonine-protein phosphatase [Methylovirgula sp. 4M-Z18]
METRADGQNLRFETAAITHPGHVRQVNEDSIFADGGRGIWVVADGMGGHRDGNVASSMIAEAARNTGRAASLMDFTEAFRSGIDAVNLKLLARSNGERQEIVGSTVAALLIQDAHYCCLWAGDSRCYLVRAGKIRQVSRDHTEVQELLDRGVLSPAEAAIWPRRNVITRAVGAIDDFQLEHATGVVKLGDCFVLCSDGLTGHVNDDEILARSRALSADQASRELLELALARGGKDNISVVIVNVVAREVTAVVMR